MGKPEGKIDTVFADMDRPQHPDAALLVIDHDRVVYRKRHGFADLENQRRITADSSFYVGSISKQFTAMAIMLLAEEGRLSYDDRLPAFFLQLPSWGGEISVHHLLHHTSGLPEYVPLFFEWAREINGLTNEAFR
jgi:CubicO group peptidase (beta-lactamase class C family)